MKPQSKFVRMLYEEQLSDCQIPSPDLAAKALVELLKLLFYQFSNRKFEKLRNFELAYAESKGHFYDLIDAIHVELDQSSESIIDSFFDRLPPIREILVEDAEAISQGDPAATNKTEVIRTYPGFFAIAVYRIAHILWELDVPYVPRIFSEYAHSITGIDIHPGATIGRRFCIDHGTGIVIGETTIIGEDVKLYQGVTLGALSVEKELAATKRHPTIEDNVVIYAGATILGGKTFIGKDSIIGGNVWLTKSIPPETTVYYKGISQQHIENGK